MRFPGLGDAGFWFGFIISSFMGLILTYSSMLCTIYNSPLATSVAGNAKDIITTGAGTCGTLTHKICKHVSLAAYSSHTLQCSACIAGWFFFGGFKATPRSVTGLTLSFIGAFMYSAVNLMKARQNATDSQDRTSAASKTASDAGQPHDASSVSSATAPVLAREGTEAIDGGKQ